MSFARALSEKESLEIMGELKYKPEYLLDRGFSQETIDHFGAGFYIPSKFVIHQRSVFPVHNVEGGLVGFLGRSVHPRNKWTGGFYPKDFKPQKGLGQWYGKWRSYPQTIMGRGRINSDLYNLNRVSKKIQDTGTCILVEGAMDVWNLWQNGIDAVAAVGIKVTRNNIDKLLKAGCKKLKVMFDGDRPGLKGAKSIKKKYGNLMDIEIIRIPDGKDPGDMSKSQIDEIRHKLV